VASSKRAVLRVYGVFAGVGGLEKGLSDAGHKTVGLCESDPLARLVLYRRFRIWAHPDILELDLPANVDLLAAGFPCQDLSQAGRTAGIHGSQSGLVTRIFELLSRRSSPEWVLLENVPNMLRLHGGSAIRFITGELGRLKYRWAYRVVDTRAFGLPQRRLRAFLLASRVADPAGILLGQRATLAWPEDNHNVDAGAFGFYWTEGNSGIGWAKESVPPLKGGSGFGIPSPPAIWLRSRTGARASFVTPSIADAERLQGFDPEWTKLPEGQPDRFRWRLLGNAVSVPVSKWIGDRIAGGEHPAPTGTSFSPAVCERWPTAAYGDAKRAFAVEASVAPIAHAKRLLLSSFLHRETAKPLSTSAAGGFLFRLERSGLRAPREFLVALRQHIVDEGHVQVA